MKKSLLPVWTIAKFEDKEKAIELAKKCSQQVPEIYFEVICEYDKKKKYRIQASITELDLKFLENIERFYIEI